jgi:apolipoprotein N-acyltransferase
MIAGYFQTSTGVAWLAAALATAATGAFYGLFGAALAFLARLRRPSALAVALLFGACEYGRTAVPLANPWMLAGYSQAPVGWIRQLADLGGVSSIGMLLMGVNAALAGAVDARWRPRRPRAAAAATVAVLAAVLGYGALRLGTRYGEGPELRVVLVQSAVPRERRFAPAFRQANLAHHADLAVRAASSRPDLVLLPELAVDVPLVHGSREVRAFGRVAERSGADVLVGAPLQPGGFVARPPYNSYFLLRGSSLADRYDKIELAPFSERNPFPGRLALETIEYAAGRSRRPLASRAGQLGILLCSEAMFGPLARRAVREGAAILVNPANDSWFGNVGAARAQLDVARMRAVETRRWLARPTMTGITAIVDAHGRVTAEAPAEAPALLEGVLRRSSATTLYTRLGEWCGQLACGVALGHLAWAAIRARRAASEGGP